MAATGVAAETSFSIKPRESMGCARFAAQVGLLRFVGLAPKEASLHRKAVPCGTTHPAEQNAANLLCIIMLLAYTVQAIL